MSSAGVVKWIFGIAKNPEDYADINTLMNKIEASGKDTTGKIRKWIDYEGYSSSYFSEIQSKIDDYGVVIEKEIEYARVKQEEIIYKEKEKLQEIKDNVNESYDIEALKDYQTESEDQQKIIDKRIANLERLEAKAEDLKKFGNRRK